MSRVLLTVMTVLAVELLLIVGIGKAIGYRDRISREKRRASFRLVGMPAVGEPLAIRRRAS